MIISSRLEGKCGADEDDPESLEEGPKDVQNELSHRHGLAPKMNRTRDEHER